MAFIDKKNTVQVFDSVQIASKVDSVNTLISKITESVNDEIVYSDFRPNGDSSKIIYVNDSFQTNIDKNIDELTLTAVQGAVLKGAKIVYGLDTYYEIIVHLFDKIFNINVLNVQGSIALKSAKVESVKSTTVLNNKYNMFDAITLIMIVGKIQIADRQILKMMGNLVDNMMNKSSELISNVFGVMEFNIQNNIYAYNSKFTDTINGQFAPGLILSVTHKNVNGSVTIEKSNKTVSGDGTVGVNVNETTNAYTTLDGGLILLYEYNLETSYALSSLYSYNSILSNKLKQLESVAMSIYLTVEDTGIIA